MFRTHWLIGSWLSLAMALCFPPALLFGQWSSSSSRPLLRYSYSSGYYGSSDLRIPPGARGYQVTKLIEQHHLVAEKSVYAPRTVRSAPVEPAPTALAVGINQPPSEPMTVAIRGPDGKVRHFPVASPEAIRPRTIIVHPGEKLSITLDGSVRVQIQPK